MDNNWAIKIEHLNKIYKIFDRPVDRVKEALNPFNKRYSKDFYALNDVSLTIRKGETVGIIGKNGAGKSTLLKIITGVLTPTSGKLETKGRIASLLELGGGFNPELTGVENILMNGTIMGYSDEEMKPRIQQIIDFADIGDFINQPVKMYSSGMFARLAFSVNAFVAPDILIVDEALSVGDIKFQVKCMEKMEELMHGGCTVLFVSHDLNVLRRLCKRSFFFEHGRLIADGETNVVADKYLEFMDDGIENKSCHRTGKFATNSDIAAITAFHLMDCNGVEKDEFEYNEPIRVVVEYEVFDETMAGAVLGIAVKAAGERYICGLNTYLDEIEIPWKKGHNSYQLEYPNGLLALGGKYHFDVALEEKTATVPIHYVQYVQDISIASGYISEGVYTIPHVWGENNGQIGSKI